MTDTTPTKTCGTPDARLHPLGALKSPFRALVHPREALCKALADGTRRVELLACRRQDIDQRLVFWPSSRQVHDGLIGLGERNGKGALIDEIPPVERGGNGQEERPVDGTHRKRAAGHTVTRNGKPTRYELYTGFAYDLEEKRINDSHASSGLAEVFVLEKEGGKWAIKLHGKDEVGAWGKTPDAEDWRFMQVGGQNWGYAVETAYTGQGSTVTGLFLLFSDNRNRIANSYIPTGLDNGAHYGNCTV